MADGATFNISVDAQSLGVDDASAALTKLTDRIRGTHATASQFDNVVAAANVRLTEAKAVAASFAGELADASKEYGRLQSTANKAALAVEAAVEAGGDTTKLQAKADKATAAMQRQGAAVDALKEKSDAAKSSQERLAKSMSALETNAAKNAAEFDKIKTAAQNKVRADAERFADQRKASAEKSAAATAAAQQAFAKGYVGAVLAIATAAVAGTLALASFAISANPMAVARLSAASERLNLQLKALFKGINLDKFIAGVEDVVGMFQEGTSTSKALKLILETVLQPLFDGATALMPLFKEMFKGFVVGILDFITWTVKASTYLIRLIPAEVRKDIKEFTDKIDWMKVALTAGMAVGVAFGVVLAIVAAAFVSAGVAIALTMLPLTLLVAAIVLCIYYWDEIKTTIIAAIDAAVAWVLDGFNSMVEAIYDFVSDANDELMGLPKMALDAAKGLIAGMVAGITGGATAVYDAIKDVAKGSISAFKSYLGIKSPSVAFKVQAGFVGEGIVEGIESKQGDVDTAVESMVDPSLIRDAKAPGSPSGSGGSGSPPRAESRGDSKPSTTITIANLTVGEGPVAQSNWAELRKMLREEFAGAKLTIGGGEPAT